ncbi:ABC transporter permease [Romboutsia sp. 1001216sp1]|uniref:ABC transporter permease n=1 Tax=unclassified Romboutsia TaxID=2626894 RepID=UPI0018A0B367|nr:MULTISPECIES: ABC transporter permease [unclassified Romboutsia]MDB8789160.1 ABC transporter permease [Romboutsia sp. 1001216sp1]MDB8802255.1 ABC transporter permease [Romboutsia sp. 1001216sp1]MDB8813652.1 ABC transporter permease [Romboutsia sp. 1001216sp1]
MLNYIKSEFYRNINTKGNYIFLFGSIAFVIFINVALGLFAQSQVNFPYGNTKYSLSSFYTYMGLLILISIYLVSLIFGQEFKNSTLKNSIAFGISRSEIYLGKFLVEVVICTINLILISSAYVIAAYVMLEDSGIVYLKDFIHAIVACFPLLLVSMTAAHCFYFIFDNESIAVTFWSIFIVFVPLLISMAGRKIDILGKIARWLPWNIVGNATFDSNTNRIIMAWNTTDGFVRCFIVGFIGVVLFYTLGLIMFKKKEIK